MCEDLQNEDQISELMNIMVFVAEHSCYCRTVDTLMVRGLNQLLPALTPLSDGLKRRIPA